jgi:branched-chain amino acid transport system ATP-binding protein
VFYGELQVLWNVSLTVKKDDFVAVIGANGAGKTTLLMTIAGILRPRSGTITFLDNRIDKVPAHTLIKAGLSLVPEGRMLFPKMTVIDNLRLGALTLRSKKKEAERMDLVYNLFPILRQRRGQIASTLSGGEQQMLAIGRGLMTGVKLLMLDEPTLGLSPKASFDLFDALAWIHKELGITILLVEQNIRHALKLANRGYVLERGRISLEDVSSRLLNNTHVKEAYLGA